MCVHFNGVSVQDVWAISPLIYRIDSSWHQHRVATQYLQVLHGAITTNYRFEDYCALNSGGYR
jgi:hypothetical protein